MPVIISTWREERSENLPQNGADTSEASPESAKRMARLAMASPPLSRASVA